MLIFKEVSFVKKNGKSEKMKVALDTLTVFKKSLIEMGCTDIKVSQESILELNDYLEEDVD